MFSISFNPSETCNGDVSLSTDNGFPIAYAGRGSYAGEITIHSYHAISETETVHLIYIGRYTSIGGNVQIICDMNHDYRSVYQGVISDYANSSPGSTFRENYGQATKNLRRKGMVIIGNDVWIGNDVSIISDVVIGNGAVIGAGSVIRQDIPPYTIWYGNPAVCIGKRFSDDIIADMQKISWWEFPNLKIREIESDMKGDVQSFVEKYKDYAYFSANDNILAGPHNTIGSKYLVFLDICSRFPTFPDVLEQFCTICGNSSILYFCYNNSNPAEKDAIASIMDLLLELQGKANIQLIEFSDDMVESLIRESDYFIIGRDIKNITRISYALKYNVKCLSGANIPIFHPNNT